MRERVFKVNHTDEQLEEELYSIIDLGGTVVNVMVNHRVYGHMEAELRINSRRKSRSIYGRISGGKSESAEKYHFNYHYHKVAADSEETLDLIEGGTAAKTFFLYRENSLRQ